MMLQRTEYLDIRAMLRSKRSTFWDHWRDLAEQVLPRHARFFREDRNRAGTKRNDKILNGTPTKSARVCSSGMAASITSPVRIWFRMGTDNPALKKNARVQSYLHEVEQIMRQIMASSNFYNGMGHIYLDLVVFGTAAMLIEEDDEGIVRCYPLMIGSYYLESSHKLMVDTCYREISMTVKQVVKKFGLKNCSPHVQSLFREKKHYQWIDILHIIEPNDEYQPDMMGKDGMKYRSIWLEERSEGESLLKVGGYREFPIIAPRWEVTAEDNYGYSPGMDALGDCRMLQKMETQNLKNFDKATDPPLVGPTTLRNQRTSLLPGDITYSDGVQGNSLKPIQDPRDSAEASKIGDAKVERIEARIREFFYADMWRSMQEKEESGGVQPETARWVDEVHEEKMIQLGPMLSRLDNEGLNPAIRRIYGLGLRAKMFPPLPPELRGQNIKITYINIMAQAQKLLETSGVERLAGFTASLSAQHPEANDLIDVDVMVRDYADMLSTNPDMLLGDDQVKQIRAKKAAAAQAQQTAAGASQGAQTAKNLSQVPMNEDNGLTRLMAQFAPGSTPSIPNIPPAQGVQ